MRILYNNRLNANGTFTATNEDANYPLTEVLDDTLQSLFKSTTSTTLITQTWTADETIPGIAFGNTNATQIQITLRNASDTILMQETLSGTDIQFDGSFPGNVYYPTYTGGVRKLEIEADGPDPVYFGGLFAGDYIQYDQIIPGSTTGFQSSSGMEKTRFGISFGTPGEIIQTQSFVIADDIDITGYNDFTTFKRVTGRDSTVWLDVWHSVDEIAPMFCNITNDPSLSKQRGLFRWDGLAFDFEECK